MGTDGGITDHYSMGRSGTTVIVALAMFEKVLVPEAD